MDNIPNSILQSMHHFIQYYFIKYQNQSMVWTKKWPWKRLQHYLLSTTMGQYPHLALSTFSSLCVCVCVHVQSVCVHVCLHLSEFQVRTILTWPVSEFNIMPSHNISGHVTDRSKCQYCQLFCEWMNACLCCVSWLCSCHAAVCLLSMRCSACIQHSGYI